MPSRLFLALAGALLLLRLPSLVQPMGADQGLYAYVGERILAGDLPYRDAWDQKPPAIHYAYAADARRVARRRRRRRRRSPRRRSGRVAALPVGHGASDRQPEAGPPHSCSSCCRTRRSPGSGGIRLRAQCETFIAVAVAGAFLLLRGSPQPGEPDGPLSERALCSGSRSSSSTTPGSTSPQAWRAAWLWGRLTLVVMSRRLAAGFAVPVVVMVAIFSAGGALRDLYDATIAYNVHYSGETYAGPGDAVWYLLTFPIERARVDALWTVGGAGCLLLILLARLEARAPRRPALGWRGLSLDRGEWQPRPATVFRAGQPGARARGSLGSVRDVAVGPVVGRETSARSGTRGHPGDLGRRLEGESVPEAGQQTSFDASYLLGRLDQGRLPLALRRTTASTPPLASAELAETVRVADAAARSRSMSSASPARHTSTPIERARRASSGAGRSSSTSKPGRPAMASTACSRISTSDRPP